MLACRLEIWKAVVQKWTLPELKGETPNPSLTTQRQLTSQSEDIALLFHKAVSHSSFNPSKDNTENESDVGTVEVLFYEDILLEGTYQINDVVSNFTGTSQVKDSQQHDSKKYLKSQSGKRQKLSHDNGIRQNYKLEYKLDSIKVRYCSTVGLIENGVLPKPPMWEWYKMLNPMKRITTQVVPSEKQIHSKKIDK